MQDNRELNEMWEDNFSKIELSSQSQFFSHYNSLVLDKTVDIIRQSLTRTFNEVHQSLVSKDPLRVYCSLSQLRQALYSIREWPAQMAVAPCHWLAINSTTKEPVDTNFLVDNIPDLGYGIVMSFLDNQTFIIGIQKINENGQVDGTNSMEEIKNLLQDQDLIFKHCSDYSVSNLLDIRNYEKYARDMVNAPKATKLFKELVFRLRQDINLEDLITQYLFISKTIYPTDLDQHKIPTVTRFSTKLLAECENQWRATGVLPCHQKRVCVLEIDEEQWNETVLEEGITSKFSNTEINMTVVRKSIATNKTEEFALKEIAIQNSLSTSFPNFFPMVYCAEILEDSRVHLYMAEAGITMDKFIEQEGNLNTRRKLLAQVADIFLLLGAQGYHHGDMFYDFKRTNIMVKQQANGEYHPVLIDFEVTQHIYGTNEKASFDEYRYPETTDKVGFKRLARDLLQCNDDDKIDITEETLNKDILINTKQQQQEEEFPGSAIFNRLKSLFKSLRVLDLKGEF